MKRDILSWIRRNPKKLSIAKQEHVIELFHNLYSSGFHLSEVIDFLRRSQLVEIVKEFNDMFLLSNR